VNGTDGKAVGHVRKLFTYQDTGTLTHFLLERGGMLEKHRYIIPVDWVNEIHADAISLAVDSGFLDQLPEYRDNFEGS
jgi:hypothetical protein